MNPFGKIFIAYRYTDDLVGKFFSSAVVREFESIYNMISFLDTETKATNLRIKKFKILVYRKNGDDSFLLEGEETDLRSFVELITLGDKAYFTFEEARNFVDSFTQKDL